MITILVVHGNGWRLVGIESTRVNDTISSQRNCPLVYIVLIVYNHSAWVQSHSHTVTSISSFIAVTLIRITVLCHYDGAQNGKQNKQSHFLIDFVHIWKYRHSRIPIGFYCECLPLCSLSRDYRVSLICFSFHLFLCLMERERSVALW